MEDPDILFKIYEYLSAKDRVNLSSTCRGAREILGLFKRGALGRYQESLPQDSVLTFFEDFRVWGNCAQHRALIRDLGFFPGDQAAFLKHFAQISPVIVSRYSPFYDVLQALCDEEGSALQEVEGISLAALGVDAPTHIKMGAEHQLRPYCVFGMPEDLNNLQDSGDAIQAFLETNYVALEDVDLEQEPPRAPFIAVTGSGGQETPELLAAFSSQYPDKTIIADYGDACLSSRLRLEGTRKLVVVDRGQATTEIRDSFLMHHESLVSVDLSPLTKVTFVGGYFLLDCNGLLSVDLSPFRKVKHLESHFLSVCYGLKSVDLSPLRNLRFVGGFFLTHCSGLKSLDLYALRNLTSVGCSFLEGCFGLTSVDLAPFGQLGYVGRSFMAQCTGLSSIDLRPLKHVKSVGPYFLLECTGLAPENVIDPYNVWNFVASERGKTLLRDVRGARG